MRAAVVNAVGDGFTITDLHIDEPRGREVLIDVKAAGLCHSDLHFADHDFGTPMPAVLGHESAGVVLAVGPDVRDVRVGDHVVACLIRACGHCLACEAGRGYRCTNRNELLRTPDEPAKLTTVDGTPVTPAFGTAGFAERTLVDERQLAVLPKEMPFAQAAVLGCAVATGIGSALNTAAIVPGDTVAVIGLGGIGLNVLSGARLAEASTIIGIDRNPEALKLANRFGATHTIDASAQDPVGAVREITGGGVMHAFEAVGLETTTQQAVRMTAVGGTAWLIGLHRLDATTTLSMQQDVLMPQRSIVGTYMGSTDVQRDLPRYAQWYLDGRINLDDLVADQIDVSEINAGFDRMRQGAIARTVITSWDA